MTNRMPYSRLLNRYWVAFYVLTLLLFAAASHWFFNRVEAPAIRLAYYHELEGIGDLKTKEVVDWRWERLGDITNLARNEFIVKAIRASLKDPGNLPLREELIQSLKLVQTTYTYSGAFLIGLDERILLSTGDIPFQWNAATRKTCSKLQANHEPMISDLFLNENGAVFVDAAASVTEVDGRPVAFLILRSDAERFLFPLIQSWPVPSKTAETELVQKEEEDVLLLNKLSFSSEAGRSLRISLKQSEALAVRAALGNQGMFEGLDHRGMEVLADLRPIPGCSWFMISKINHSEIQDEVNYHAGVITALIVFSILIVTAVFVLGYRHRAARLYRDLYEVEKQNRLNLEEHDRMELSLLNEEKRVQLLLDSTGEGICGLDREGKITFCNPACLKMLGYPEPGDLVGQVMHSKLHYQHEDKSHYPMEDCPILTTYLHGKNCHIDSDVFWRADGTCLPVEYWSYPQMSGQEILGAVVTFVDITQRKQRLRAMETALNLRHLLPCQSIQEVIEHTLEQAIAITQSTIGYFHYVNADQKTIRLCTWSQGTRQSCAVPQLEAHYPLDQAGVWTDCLHHKKPVVHNDYVSLPLKRGLPEGHIPLSRDVGVPILYRDRAVAILGVGNKPNDYQPSDITALSLICETLGGILSLQETQESLETSRRAALSLLQDTQIQQTLAEEALERATVAEHESEQRAKWAQGLQEAGQKLATCATIEATAQTAVQSLVDYLEMKMAWLTMPQKGGGMRRFAAGLLHDDAANGLCACARAVWARKSPILSPDVIADQGFAEGCVRRAQQQEFASCGSFPIMTGETCVAVLSVCDTDAGRNCRLLTARPLIEVFCRQVGHVWQRCLDEEEKRHLVRAIEDSPASVVITDQNAVIEYVNPKFTEITGYTKEEAVGQNPRILQSGLLPAEFYAEMWQTLIEGKDWRGEFCNKKKSGEIFWEMASISPIRDVGGTVYRYVAVKEDITESKRIMQELIRSQAEAERANRSKSIFLANMSHEIRTPMNAILGYCQLLQREKGLNAKQNEYIRTIAWSGDHLLAIINDVLEMSKIESGRVTLNSALCDLSGLLKDVEMMFQGRLEAKGLLLQFQQIGEIPLYIFADEAKVRQVLINLLGNAVKFTDQGSIVVRVWAKNWTGDGMHLVFEVEDTGCGIAPEDLERVFVAFEQVHSGFKSSGTGLGLPISRRYARMMGGELTASSELGKGSIFRFEFQAIRGHESEHLTLKRPDRIIGLKSDQPPFRLLVVDDLEENRQPLVRLLTKVGFLVREAQSGEEALAIFQEWHPQLIMMDMKMPGMDGREALRCIKGMPAGQDTIILMLSASVMEEDRDSSYAAGADGFIRKPFQEDEIFDALRRFLNLQYIYESRESTDHPLAETTPVGVSKEMMQTLPPGMVTSMYDAVATAHMDHFLALVESCREQHPQTSEALFALAEQFDYDKLLELLEVEKG